jgi:predicted acylesterase/phospholipase RssA
MSNTKNTENTRAYKNLVISGGGILGLSLTTAFKAMNNLGKMVPIEKVCGTSVGSMFGVFVACKLSNPEIDNYTDKFYDELTSLPETVVEQGYNMYEHIGLHDNKNIYKVINELLFDKYNVRDMTLKQLYDITKVEYTAVTMCMDTRQAVYLNYKNFPDLAVGKAVQMSAAVPFFFVQVKWHGMTFCDGGALDNMPIDYYDYENGTFNDETLGLHFKSTGEPKKYKTDSILAVLEGVENAQIENN